MKRFRLRKSYLTLIYFFILGYLEIFFKVLTNKSVFNISLFYILIYALGIAFLLNLFTSLFKEKINYVIYYIIVFLNCLLFAAQYCVFKIFGFYFNFGLVAAADQVMEFASDGVKLVLENIFGVMVLFLPFVLSIALHRYIKTNRKRMKHNILLLGGAFVSFLIFYVSLNVSKSEEYDLYFNVNNSELSIQRLGVANTFWLDLRRSIFGFDEKINLDVPDLNINTPDDEDNEETPIITYDYNNLAYDFDSLINSTSDTTLKQMHQYFKNETGTLQNEYTKYFEGKNLILFMAESFNEIAVSEEKTPTLYKLVHNGFEFTNFYTPTISSTIGGEFQELTGLVAASGFLGPWKIGENAYPFGIANVFKNKGYNTFAYHDHNYTFQSRNKYLKDLGFDNFKGCRNGLEELINCKQWPESDVEMIDVTTSDFLNSEEPFFVYYVTVSGHGDYGWSNTAMGRKHKDEVSDLPYSEKVLSYLAAQMELDQALELLINRLDEAGKLDDTVIALVGDHYPYYLSTEEVNEVSSYEKDSVVEINHSNFILWNNKMDKVTVDKVGSQIDVLPTIYNLFGIPYDSRLIIGKDILSTEPGLAIFGNRSWVSDYGTYFAGSSQFVLKDGMSVDSDYVKTMNQIVANKMNMSKLIMTNDYYKYFK